MSIRATTAKVENEDLNAHLDLTEKEKDFMVTRRRQQTRLKLQTRSDSVPDLSRAEETYNRYMTGRLGLPAYGQAAVEGRVYEGEGVQQRPQHLQE